MHHTHSPCGARRHLLCRLAALCGGGGRAAAWVAAWVAAAPMLVPLGSQAAGPLLCGNAPPPAYPAADRPASVQSWLQDGHRDGPLPDCGGLRGRDFELLVRLTASFAAPGELADMLLRLGAVSTLKGMPYWSFTDKKRATLIRESYAIDRPASMRPRADFSLAELRSGAELFFVHSDNRSNALVPYRLQLQHSGPDSFTVHVENAGDIRYMGMMMAAAHEMQWVVKLERLAPGRWGYRSLLGMQHLGMLGRAEQHRLSNLSRCVAMFDLLAGRQTEIEGYR